MRKIRIILSSIFVISTIFSSSALTLEDAVLSQKNPKQIDNVEMSYSADYYYKMKDNSIIQKISYKTGDVLSDVFDASTARNCNIKEWDGFTISEDETKILLYTNKTDIYRHSFKADYYVFEVKRNNLKPLSENGMQEAAKFSPDGRMVAFVRDNNIYLKKLDYGTEVAVTTDGKKNSIINGVTDWVYQEEFGTLSTMTFSPDNLVLSFLRSDETKVNNYDITLYQGACSEKSSKSILPTQFSYKYPLSGSKNSEVKVLSYDIETRKTKEMSLAVDKEDYIPYITFSNDSEKLMVMTLNRNQNKFNLFAVNPRSTVAKLLYTDVSKSWINIDKILSMTRFYNDSFIIPSEKSGHNHLYKYSLSGALIGQITQGDWEVTDFYGFNEKTKSYYFQSTIQGAINRTINCIDSKNKILNLSQAEGWNKAMFNKDCSYFILNYSSATIPNQYTLWSNGKMVRKIEMNEDYSAIYTDKDVPHKEFFTFKSGANVFNGYMIKPVNFEQSKKYPVIMNQYSGPSSQQVVNSWKIDWEQYAASQGYIVVCVDGRGTGGRGTEWESVVYMQLGKYESIDQIAATKYLSSISYIDSSKIGIFGWSYGGYETLMAMSQADSPYTAGVAVAPVTDWRYYDSIYSERYMRTPQENEAGYNNSSAIRLIPNHKGELLIISGTADDNVHLSNTLDYVASMTANNKLCDMMLYPNMNHSINFCEARLPLYRKILKFYDSKLK
ncbi:MAG: S9 family peptidase [Muribaculaceae bacterium]|nr:S9 family peptidase [Muribaculaceae bacterium]